jgi:hypothetical protein
MLSVILLSLIMISCSQSFMLSITIKVIILSVIVLSVFMLVTNAINVLHVKFPNVIMLNVMAPAGGRRGEGGGNI